MFISNKWFFAIFIIIFVFINNIVYSQGVDNERVFFPDPYYSKLVKLSHYYFSKSNFVSERELDNYVKNIINYYENYLLKYSFKNKASSIIFVIINENSEVNFWLIDNYSNSSNNELKYLFMNINPPIVNDSNAYVIMFIGNYQEINEKLNENIRLVDNFEELTRNGILHSDKREEILDIIFENIIK